MISARQLYAIFVPAAVFQSVIVGGAYGTGREVVEYISSYGALGGLLVIAVVGTLFAVVLSISFEFARVFAARDYRHFLRELLGPGWILYEFMFVALLVVILAITAAASAQVLSDAYGIPHYIGIALLCALVITLNFFGRQAIKATLTAGAAVLMLALFVYCAFALNVSAEPAIVSFREGQVHAGWLLSAAKFAVYNSALIPAIVYAAGDLPNRKHTFAAGCLAGVMGIVPALLLHLSFLSHLPAVLDEPIPTYWTIAQLGFVAATPIYVLILFATIVQTAVGVLHGLSERIDGWLLDNNRSALPGAYHAMVAAVVLTSSLVLSKLGIVTLIASGYGTLAWGFFVVFTLPLLTIGLYKVFSSTTGGSVNDASDNR